jgi:hypothetical protein
METIAKADIFFFITSIAVIGIGFLAAIAAIYVINILRDVRKVSKTVSREADQLAGDLDEMRSKVKTGRTMSALYDFFKKLFKRRKGRN